MVMKGPSIVIWCGAASNQKALVNKIAAEFNLKGIVRENKASGTGKKKLGSLPSLIWDRFRFKSIYDAWKNMQIQYDQKFPSWPEVPTLELSNINDKATFEFTRECQPDLIIVSGTALIKDKDLLNFPASIGIINLHTGLSPFVKGGPNCTNWCIANNSFNLVGNTIMWLNSGIDSGNIITTEALDITADRDLNEAHIHVMEHAHDLYIRSIRYLFSSSTPYNSVPQQKLGKGQLFLTKMWTSEKRKALLRNWRQRKKTSSLPPPETIPLP
jgi:methionyl-tRNA formyltransferase